MHVDHLSKIREYNKTRTNFTFHFLLCAILLSFVVEFDFSFLLLTFLSLLPTFLFPRKNRKKRTFIHTEIFHSSSLSKEHQVEGHDHEDHIYTHTSFLFFLVYIISNESTKRMRIRIEYRYLIDKN